MSLALARKYRPSTFDDLVGQDAVSQTLSLALDGDRLSHAYLFSGLRGSGKTSTARIFAKALLCEQGLSSKPCNQCDQCTMANESRHMDIIEMDAASNRGIDDIKELIEHTKYKPGTGRFKIFIIDEVHMLTTQAFNALLKTLEEPPDFVKFILATTDPLKLPATILSRTQHFRFKKIPQKLVISHLQYILDTEKIAYDKEALVIIARSGAGSLRDSLTLLDQAIVYSKNHVDVATLTNMLGIIEPSRLAHLLDDIQKKNEAGILDFVRQAGDFEAEMIIDELSLHLKAHLLESNPQFGPLVIDRFFRILADAKEMLGLGSDGEFVLALTLFKMKEALSIQDIDTMIHALQKELSGVKAPEPRAPQKAKQEETASPSTPRRPDAPISEKRPREAAADPAETTRHTDESDHPAPSIPEQTDASLAFEKLVRKIYDRDYDLGEIFERNITFQRYENGTLTWISSAEGADKKMLISGWNVIKMFVQEIWGLETRIANIPAASKKKTPLSNLRGPETSQPDSIPPQSASTIESIGFGDGSVAPDPDTTEAAKEKDPSTLLQEPMIKEMIELFDPKKVRIVRKS